MVFMLDDKLTFGKYKGKIVRDICNDDPEYIEWANDEIDWFLLDIETEDYLFECLSDLPLDHLDYEHYLRYGN